jgi:hypothetical protein
MKRSLNSRKLKEALSIEFDNKCAYCGSQLGITDFGNIEHFYPVSRFPDQALNPDNLLFVCHVCNISKADKFPLDSTGSPLLLNPRVDKFEEHIRLNPDGTVSPLTERGEVTIQMLNLNRAGLVETRRSREIEEKYFSEFDASPPDTYKVFKESLLKIRQLNNHDVSDKAELQQHINNMLYANVITALETYLCDSFIEKATSSNELFRKFVETFHEFHREKFELNELFRVHDEIRDKAIRAMRDVIYHDLPKVSGMYQDTFGIEFPKFGEIYKSVFIRHDLVHRNGKSKDGNKHQIKQSDIDALCEMVDNFVEELHAALSTQKP